MIMELLALVLCLLQICCICSRHVSSASSYNSLVYDAENGNAIHFNKASMLSRSHRFLKNASPTTSSSGPWVQLGTDIYGGRVWGDSTWSKRDRFGSSVATSKDGTYIIIGGPFGSNGSIGDYYGKRNFPGYARVLRFNEHTKAWTQIGGDIEGEEIFDRSGWSVDMNGDGDVVVIGAPDNGPFSGHARIYRKIHGVWVKQGQDLDGDRGNYGFGQSVAISFDGGRVIIGGQFGNDNISGSVKVYEYNGDTQRWLQIGADINGEEAHDKFGYSVDMNGGGNVVIIGAPSNDDNGNNSGNVRIYQDIAGQWIQKGQGLKGTEEHSSFGKSVAISLDGNRVIIGAPFNNRKPGRARVYEFIEDDNTLRWVQIGKDIVGEEENDEFGSSVDMNGDGDIVIIGATRHDGNGSNGGRARVYKSWDGKWIQKGQELDGANSYDEFGFSVAISLDGNRVIAGAPSNDDRGSDLGHVRAFEFDETFQSTDSMTIDLLILSTIIVLVLVFTILLPLRIKIVRRSTKANTEVACGGGNTGEQEREQEDENEVLGTTSFILPVPVPVAQEIEHGSDCNDTLLVAQVMYSQPQAGGQTRTTSSVPAPTVELSP